MGFLTRLLSKSENGADSIVTGGIIAVLGFVFAQAWDVIANHREFAPVAYGLGASSILAAIGGGKTLRDRFSPAGDPPTLPEKPSETLNAGT